MKPFFYQGIKHSLHGHFKVNFQGSFLSSYEPNITVIAAMGTNRHIYSQQFRGYVKEA